jgi:UDP:flavonoid glycosyltransferase YjiC (YdhE family)
MCSKSSKLRVLFFGEGTSLAHTVRPLELAAALDPAQYDVYFCCDPRYRQLVEARGLRHRPLRCVDPATFQSRVFNASALYLEDEYRRYLDEDRFWINELRPDVVVGDFRLSLATAAELENLPSISLANVYWSPSVRLPLPVPEHPLVDWFGVWTTRQILRLTSGMFFRLQVRGINRLRRKSGLRPLADAHALFTHGTRTLYLDLPALFNVSLQLSSSEQLVGPVCWEPDIELPQFWSELDRNKPIIVITAGSSGAVDATLDAVCGLQQLEANIVLATAGRVPDDKVPAGVFSCKYVPGKKAALDADLLVCNGGIMSYQALSAGKPVLGLPLNIDQHYLLDAVVRAGAGLAVRAGRVNADTIREAASRILKTPSFRQRSEALAQKIARLKPLDALKHAIDELSGKPSLPGPQDTSHRSSPVIEEGKATWA